MKPSEDYRKGIRKADSLVDRSRKYRKRYGMHENLGYDKQNELEDYISKLDLTYQEYCYIKGYFINLCHILNGEN